MSKQFVRSAKNMMKGYSTTQVLVRDATSNDSSNPSFEILYEISKRSFDSVDFFEIMDMLDKRLNDKGKYWKHIAKSLTVLDYLVRFGSENCVLWCKQNLYIIKTLKEFKLEDDNVDESSIIRVKAKELTALLQDDERLKEERSINLKNNRRSERKNRSRRGTNATRRGTKSDEDLQKALEESRITAEEDERRRRELAQYDNQDTDYQTALQLSKEEEELKKLQELQRLQQLQQQQQQQMQFQQQPQQQEQVYYDIFGNPISPEEYLQFQQQQQAFAQQQALQQQHLEQQRLAEEQYRLLQQQQQQQQQQAYTQQQQSLQPLPTGSNNPFALNATINTSPIRPAEQQPQPQFTAPQQQQQPLQQPLKQTRTGNQSISDKYNELNNLLASGTGIDTFGNTGDQRIPAQHTQTGTFINSQGTGYKQIVNDPVKKNPFLNNQYTGLPSSNIVPSHTGYGFGNGPQQGQGQAPPPQQQQQQSQQSFSLIDL
ncbi:epsin NDAI_0D00610 [Naumovozyma dairenensis CBS 421]|uniref:ENTH domain-containing protein n=1 Tax=Naumovozyma dairenensis (strain ATCC 10597 / BCRC 20456 / CBS 421 / NBRC 0211 / NRRL Y-12639) TaxID=1071378 RepID=G0W9B4_NAUDC|nr:hypothetical protein NDAI_0D00610 [Naumovozyma dairenensis CBS 421]CCD24375.1 hypothetical protein NDAI_0D00610 [Naumovozyma dairenensis CBS 421]